MPVEWEYEDHDSRQDWSEDRYDEDWGTDDDEPVDTIPCSHCGTDVYEDAEQCPRCGEWIIDQASPLTAKPLWWQILGVLGVIAVILALLQ